jgi:hypothetical protein
MKILIDTDLLTDNVTSYTASSSDASYPVANLRDNYPGNVWKAASGTEATIKLVVSKGSAVAMFNLNATAVAISYGAGEGYVNESGYANESGYTYLTDTAATVEASDLSGANGKLWAEYTAQTVPHIVTIILTAAAAPSAGILRAGNVEEFYNPGRDGMSEGSVDYSIQATMPNGANYFRKRDVVRTHTGLSMIETRANAFIFKHDIFDAVGPMPVAVRLAADSITDDEFVVFAKRTNPVTIEHITSTLTRINFELQEVI